MLQHTAALPTVWTVGLGDVKLWKPYLLKADIKSEAYLSGTQVWASNLSCTPPLPLTPHPPPVAWKQVELSLVGGQSLARSLAECLTLFSNTSLSLQLMTHWGITVCSNIKNNRYKSDTLKLVSSMLECSAYHSTPTASYTELKFQAIPRRSSRHPIFTQGWNINLSSHNRSTSMKKKM